MAGWRLGSNLVAVVAVTLASAALAAVTFCIVEHPFLQLRAKVLRRKPAKIPEVPVPAFGRPEDVAA